jgi:hypothetical protein
MISGEIHIVAELARTSAGFARLATDLSNKVRITYPQLERPLKFQKYDRIVKDITSMIACPRVT